METELRNKYLMPIIERVVDVLIEQDCTHNTRKELMIIVEKSIYNVLDLRLTNKM